MPEPLRPIYKELLHFDISIPSTAKKIFKDDIKDLSKRNHDDAKEDNWDIDPPAEAFVDEPRFKSDFSPELYQAIDANVYESFNLVAKAKAPIKDNEPESRWMNLLRSFFRSFEDTLEQENPTAPASW